MLKKKRKAGVDTQVLGLGGSVFVHISASHRRLSLPGLTPRSQLTVAITSDHINF